MKSLVRLTANYAMQPIDDPKMLARIKKTIKTAKEIACPAFVWDVYDLDWETNGIRLRSTDLLLKGNLAQGMLKDCEKCIVFGASLGAAFDLYFKRMKSLDPQEAFLFNAAGSALIEIFMRDQEIQLKKQFPDWFFTDAFSCGYADLPMELQPAIIETLDLENKLSIVLENPALIRPEKSVTAFIGLSKKPQPHPIKICSSCESIECSFKSKDGKTCYEQLDIKNMQKSPDIYP